MAQVAGAKPPPCPQTRKALDIASAAASATPVPTYTQTSHPPEPPASSTTTCRTPSPQSSLTQQTLHYDAPSATPQHAFLPLPHTSSVCWPSWFDRCCKIAHASRARGGATSGRGAGAGNSAAGGSNAWRRRAAARTRRYRRRCSDAIASSLRWTYFFTRSLALARRLSVKNCGSGHVRAGRGNTRGGALGARAHRRACATATAHTPPVQPPAPCPPAPPLCPLTSSPGASCVSR